MTYLVCMLLNKIIIPTFSPSIRVIVSLLLIVRRMFIYVYDITTRLLIISCNNIMLTTTTALYAGSVYHVLQ